MYKLRCFQWWCVHLQYTVLLLSFRIRLPKITLTQTHIYVDNNLAIPIPLSISLIYSVPFVFPLAHH